MSKKLFLADDEPLILEGLKCALEWEAMDIEICGTAINGIDAWAQIKKHSPDIVITDIKMASMDGLELTKKITTMQVRPSVIIISGYSDFQYAKQAIQLQVSSYLIKPIDRSELLESVKRALSELDDRSSYERMKSIKQWCEHDSLIENHLLKENPKIDSLDVPKLSNCLYVAVLKDLDTPNTSKSDQYNVEIRRIAEDCINHFILDFIFFQRQNTENEYVIILDLKNKSDNALDIVMKCTSKLEDELHIKLGFHCAIGISDICFGMDKIWQGYLDAALIAQNINPNEHSPVMTKKDFSAICSDLSIDSSQLDSLIDSIEMGFHQKIKEELKIILDANVPQNFFLLHMRYTLQQILLRTYRLLDKYGKNNYGFEGSISYPFQKIKQYRDINEAVEDFSVKLVEISKLIYSKSSQNPTAIQQIKNYIDEHYCEDIPLNSIAQHFYMNAAYLSRLFKKEIGLNFNDYLTDRRMRRAALLISSTDYKLHEIASMIGYDNINYFLRRFRIFYGCTPTQYKKQHSEVKE